MSGLRCKGLYTSVRHQRQASGVSQSSAIGDYHRDAAGAAVAAFAVKPALCRVASLFSLFSLGGTGKADPCQCLVACLPSFSKLQQALASLSKRLPAHLQVAPLA
jgi:hypothetical protein